MNVENFTAEEFLEAEEAAERNGADKPVLRAIKQNLSDFPKTQERLAFQLLAIAWKALEHEGNPRKAAGLAIEMHQSVSVQRLPEYLLAIERIACKCFELMGKCRDSRFSLTLVLALSVLRRSDEKQFKVLLESLKSRSEGTSPGRDILVMFEQSESESKEALKEALRKLREVMIFP